MRRVLASSFTFLVIFCSFAISFRQVYAQAQYNVLQYVLHPTFDYHTLKYPTGLGQLTGCLVIADSGFVSSPFANPCSGPSVARVLTFGVVASIQGPGSGTEESFNEHLTDNFGVDDHPNGRENATWNFKFDFSTSALPNCLPDPTMSLKGFFIATTNMGIRNLICGDCICQDCVNLSLRFPSKSCSNT